MDLIDSQEEFEDSVNNVIREWCFSHIQTSVRSDMNLCALEMTLIQECAFYAVMTENGLKRTHHLD